MKLGTLTSPTFGAAMRKLVAASVPVKTAWKLKSITKLVNDEIAKYEELRTKLLEKHGKKKEDGTLEVGEDKQVRFEEGKLQEFVKEFDELLNLEVDVPTVSASELGDKAELTTADLMALDGVVTE